MAEKQYCVEVRYGIFARTLNYFTDSGTKAEEFKAAIERCQYSSPTSNDYYTTFKFNHGTERLEGKLIQSVSISVIEKTNKFVSGEKTPLGDKFNKPKKGGFFGW